MVNNELQNIRFKIKTDFEDMCNKVQGLGGILKGNSTQLEEYYDNEKKELTQKGYEICLTQQDPLDGDTRRGITIYMLRCIKSGQPQVTILTNPQITDILFVLGFFPITVLQRYMKTYRFEGPTEVKVTKLPHYGTFMSIKSKNIEALNLAAKKLNLNVKNNFKKTDRQLAEEYCEKYDKDILSWE